MKTAIKILNFIAPVIFLGCEPRPKTVSKISFTCKKPVKYLFINGINNYKDEAEDSKEKLSDITEKEFELLYNVSEKGIKDIPILKDIPIINDIPVNDLAQSYKQKKDQDSKTTNTVFFIDALTNLITKFSKNHNRDEIYNAEELEQIDRHIEETKNFRYVIVSHSQGNMFAKELCDKATIQPEIHAVATPLNDKPKCEKNFYTFKHDMITNIGRNGNYIFNDNTFKEKILGYLSEKFLVPRTVTSGFFFHLFANYIDPEQKPISHLKSRLPKEEKPKILIEWVKSTSELWGDEARLNDQPAKSITCEDIVGHENKITIPFNPKNVLGYRFLVKVPGKDPVAIARKPEAKSPLYALVIKRNENDPNGEEYILEDGGIDALFSISE